MTLIETAADAETIDAGRSGQPRLPHPDHAVGRRHGGDRRHPPAAASPSIAGAAQRGHLLRDLEPPGGGQGDRRRAATRLLVIGAPNSSNSLRLVEVAEREGTKARLVGRGADIDFAWLEGVRTLGITAGASAPEAAGARGGRLRSPSASTSPRSRSRASRSGWSSSFPRASKPRDRGAARSRDVHRRRLQGQSRARAAGASIIRAGAREKELSGGEPLTTNNRMELLAAIRGAGGADPALPGPALHRQHLCPRRHHQWIHGWRKNGWRTADRKPVKNAELWQELLDAAAPHRVDWHWVKGHSGHPENERADALACAAALLNAKRAAE